METGLQRLLCPARSPCAMSLLFSRQGFLFCPRHALESTPFLGVAPWLGAGSPAIRLVVRVGFARGKYLFVLSLR